ncbi:alpha/beta fold hydrolase [Pseudomonas taiwanensis]|uniref:alpha/beta fold hydrolase n=1 Tax=Pseudomonas taiwanensis TaxID=470150 RepID=UPI001C4B5F6F|nr:alpha/beta hydrolase [Pseudomonas taiwanensis]
MNVYRNGLALAFSWVLAIGAAHASGPIQVQNSFDSMGPAMQSWVDGTGKTLHYLDEGPRDGLPVVLVGGNGTSGRVLALTDFLRSLREQLDLRFITLERNGFGQTAFDPAGNYQSYAEEVAALLDHLNVSRFSLVAISGGGPYVAQIASSLASRVRSVHMAAAFSQTEGVMATPARCALSDQQVAEAYLAGHYDVPSVWWDLGPNTAVNRIHGFLDEAADEGARFYYAKGSKGFNMAPLTHELRLYCDQPVADLSAVYAPVFLYYGLADATVTPAHAEFWKSRFPNVAAERLYPGEGHDVQYRHWGQILTDLAYQGQRILVCSKGRSQLVDSDQAPRLLQRGASLDICAWQQPAGHSTQQP